MKKAVIICIFAALLPANNYAALTSEQSRLLTNTINEVRYYKTPSRYIMPPETMADFAYMTGSPDNLGETLRAIVYLETTFGRTGRIGDNGDSLGCTQIKVETARYILEDILSLEEELTDVEVSRLYMYNDKLAIILSKEYLLYLMDRFKHKTANWSHSVLGYNRGPAAVSKDGLTRDPNNYVTKAKKFILDRREK